MRRVLLLFAFASTGPACTRAAVSVPASASSTQVAVPPARPPALPTPSAGASVRACRATPSTIYGDETIVFDIDAGAPPALANVELFDQHGRSRAKAQLDVPGQWRPAQLPSGDFRLQAGSNRVTCWVTVNRELPRDRAAAQK